MQIEIKKENEGRLKDVLKTVGNVKLRDARECYDYAQSKITSYLSSLRNCYKQAKDNSDIINREMENQVNVAEKLMSVSALSKVASAAYDTDSKNIVVNTHTLYFRTLNGGRYHLGHATITLNTETFNIRFNTDNARKSYWGSNCPHPHVSHRGEACLGNTGELIASLQAENEFGLIFEVLIAFLEQANTDDCAGRHAMNWDKVDEDGDVIQIGYKDKDGTRFKYGETPDEDKVDERGYCCVHCEEDIDPDDDDVYEINGESVCQECRDEYYVTCEECGELTLRGDAAYVEEIGYVCNTCLENKYVWCEICDSYEHEDDATYIDSENRSVCSTCADKYYTYCEECQEYHKSENVRYVESTGRDVCDDCLKEEYVLCHECKEYFLVGSVTTFEGEYYCEDCGVPEEDAEKEVATSEADDLKEALADAVNELFDSVPAVTVAPIMSREAFEVLQAVRAINGTLTCHGCECEVAKDEATYFGDEVYCIHCAISRI